MERPSFYVVNPPKLEHYDLDNDLAVSLAKKFREIRLYALKTEPEAFASSYDVEVKRGLDQSLDRLSNPKADHFWAIDRELTEWSKETDKQYFTDLLQSKWVGFVGLMGPLNDSDLVITAKADPHAQTTKTQVDNSDLSENNVLQRKPFHFHLVGTFVDPSARRTGLGRALIEAAVAKADRVASAQNTTARLTVLADCDAPAAQKLYENVGFRVTGEESYVQQPRSHMGETQAEERIALHMEMSRGLN